MNKRLSRLINKLNSFLLILLGFGSTLHLAGCGDGDDDTGGFEAVYGAPPVEYRYSNTSWDGELIGNSGEIRIEIKKNEAIIMTLVDGNWKSYSYICTYRSSNIILFNPQESNAIALKGEIQENIMYLTTEDDEPVATLYKSSY